MLTDFDGCRGSGPARRSNILEIEGRGVLHCCGERLDWERMDGTDILEATCERCDAVYAMDPGTDESSKDECEMAPDQTGAPPRSYSVEGCEIKEERFISASSVAFVPYGTRNVHTF